MSLSANTGLSPEQLVASRGEVSPTACILANVQRLVADTNTSIEDIAEILKLDQALSARIMHISNSVQYGRGEPCKAIEEALGRVGFREIQRLVALAASRALVAKPLDSYGLSAEQAWHESVGCAIGSSYFAELLGEDSSLAYTTGLMSGIGRQAINAQLQVQDEELILTNNRFPVFYSESEKEVLGFTQAPVAACLLKSMSFPSSVIEPVRQQDLGLYEKDAKGKARYILILSRLLYDFSFGGNERALHDCGTDVLSQVGLGSGDFKDLEPRLRDEMERAIQISYY